MRRLFRLKVTNRRRKACRLEEEICVKTRVPEPSRMDLKVRPTKRLPWIRPMSSDWLRLESR